MKQAILESAEMIDSPEIIKILIDAGVDVDTRDRKGYTTLMKTISAEVAQLLIDAGADVNATLTKRGIQNTDTVLMITESPDVVRLLVNAGANINAQNIVGYTALMNTNSFEKIKALIECGADPYIENQFGYNAFQASRETCDDYDAINRYLEHIELLYAAKRAASATEGDWLSNDKRQRI